MLAALAAALLALASSASAAPADQRSSSDKKSVDLITEYGSNAELPPNLWSCPPPAAPASARPEEENPLRDATQLKCLAEWLWSVQRYFAAGGKVKKGVEPELVASEKARAAALADRLSQWTGKIAVPPAEPAAPR
jgi:hypothetical protein